MKFSCDQCHAQYMIADEKIGPRGVKVKCKKCAHIIIVKPPAEAASDPPEEGVRRDTSKNDAAFSDGGLIGGAGAGPFNEPTQAMSREQLRSLAAAATTGGEDGTAGGSGPSAATWPPPADAPGSFAASFPDGFDGGAPAVGAGAVGGESFDGGSVFSGSFGGGDVGADSSASPDGGFGGAKTVVDGGASWGGSFGGGVAFGGSAEASPPPGEGEVNFDSAFGGAPARAPAASRPPGEKEWYVAIDEAQVGPVDLGDIEERWDAGELNEESLAWKAGMENWLPVAEIAELAYLITERPQHRVEAAPSFSASVTGSTAPATGLGPVSFGGQAGGTGTDVSWTPSAASALSSLVQEELITSPPAPEVSAGPSPSELGMPSFGASDLFGGGAAAAGPPPAALPSSMPADPFAGGSGSWATPKMRSSAGLKPIHLAFGAMGLMGVALVAVLIVILLRQPPAAPGTPAGAPIAAVGPVNQPPTTPTTPNPVTAPATATDGGSSPAGTPSTSPEPADSGRGKEKPSKPSPRNDKPAKEPRVKPGRDILDDDPPGKGGASVKPALEKNDIMNGVKGGMAAVMACIKEARGKGELAPGTHTLVLDWTITPAGSVNDAKLKGPAGVLGTSMPACFARGMRSWKFPPSKVGAPVRNFPFGPFTIK